MPKDEKNKSYLEQELDMMITYTDDMIEFTFQRAKVKLTDDLEIQMLKNMNPELSPAFELTEDQLTIGFHPPVSYSRFDDIHKKSVRSKWQLAYNIIQRIQSHSLERLKLIVSPDNILFDQGLVPHFLHSPPISMSARTTAEAWAS